MVSSVIASFKSSILIIPSSLTGKYVTLKSRDSKNPNVFLTAGCSMFVVIICLPFLDNLKAIPLIAKLSDSDPPLVK